MKYLNIFFVSFMLIGNSTFASEPNCEASMTSAPTQIDESNPSTKLSKVKYHLPLTVPGFCQDGERIGEHRMNCVRWIEIDFENRTARVMMTDIPLRARVSLDITTLIVEIDDANAAKEQLVFMIQTNGDLLDRAGNTWRRASD